VVTRALYGQWAHCEGEAAFYRHADAHLRGAFPRLPAHSQYNRTLRACHDAIVAVGVRLARLLDAATCAYEALDATGVVTRNSKRRGHGWLDGQATKGWCTLSARTRGTTAYFERLDRAAAWAPFFTV